MASFATEPRFELEKIVRERTNAHNALSVHVANAMRGPLPIGIEMSSANLLTVLYDADCGVCTHTARLMARLDSGRRLKLVALQRAHLPGQPPMDVLSEALHVVDGEGRWSVGAAATLEIARRLPALRPLTSLASLPFAMAALDVGYRVVADNRHQISRLLGLQVCKVRSS
jgi:predicted DCC family thiol-disulfide oxidoreductase YuxK